MTGKVKVKSPVSSTTLASEVSGARAAEAKTAPMATTAYRAGGPADGPNRWATSSPKAMPEGAPRSPEARPGGAPDNRRGCNPPAGPADAQGHAAGQDLPGRQHEQEPE